jgi:peptidoglycan/LPS O-acetylase OafA/YrhL
LSRVPRRAVAWAIFVLGVLAIVSAGAAATSERESSRWLWLAFLALGEFVVTIALVRTRQWRFAPRTRLRAIVLAAAAGVTIFVSAYGAESLRIAGVSTLGALAVAASGPRSRRQRDRGRDDVTHVPLR